MSNIDWIKLDSLEQLDAIQASPHYAVVFKHSTRCPVSSMAKRSLEHDANLIPENIPFYYLDLIAYREISNKIEEIWHVQHESPQILTIKGKECTYHCSHSDIDMGKIVNFIKVTNP